jgi:perosamine synthetase
MTTGEGGMILTDDRAVHERVRRLRNQGTSPARRYWHEELGFNYRMTNIQAALGLAQLGRLEATLAHRRRLWDWYRQQLAGTAGVVLQAAESRSLPVHWMVALRYEPWHTYEQRDSAMEELARRGIETRPMFYPLHELPACAGFPRAENLTNAVTLARSGIVLPSSPLLGESDVAEICVEFKAVL